MAVVNRHEEKTMQDRLLIFIYFLFPVFSLNVGNFNLSDTENSISTSLHIIKNKSK